MSVDLSKPIDMRQCEIRRITRWDNGARVKPLTASGRAVEGINAHNSSIRHMRSMAAEFGGRVYYADGWWNYVHAESGFSQKCSFVLL